MSNTCVAIIIAPHQDDEIIGCGGTIVKMVNAGIKVYVQHIYAGNSGVLDNSGQAVGQIRDEEASVAAKIGGYTLLPNLGFEDRKSHSEADIYYKVVKVFRKYRPSLIFAPHDNDQDFEHQIVAKAAWEATWLTGAQIYPEFKLTGPYKPETYFGYEVWRPIEKVNMFMDISNEIGKKTGMLEVFKSQMSLTGWVRGSIGLNAYRGTMLLGEGYAEAFTVRSLTSDPLSAILKKVQEK